MSRQVVFTHPRPEITRPVARRGAHHRHRPACDRLPGMTTTIPALFDALAREAGSQRHLFWDLEIGEFRGVEGPRGFGTYREAVEASRLPS